jgi:hypothetical protein
MKDFEAIEETRKPRDASGRRENKLAAVSRRSVR